MIERIATLQIPILIALSTDRPVKPYAVRVIINRSLRSAIPPLHSIPSDSALALMYETINEVKAAIKNTGTSGSDLSI